jgi:hypothetical protein
MVIDPRKFDIKFDRARLEGRLRWMGYRYVGLLGAPGLIAAVLLLGALGVELALVRPKLAQQQDALERIAQQRLAHGRGSIGPAGTGAAAVLQRDADVPLLLALIDKHGLPAHEVKYRQIAAGRPAPGANRGGSAGDTAAQPPGARVAMALPTSGSYSQFHELIAGLSAFRGVRAESFTLRRNLPTERMLAIDLNLSMPAPLAATGKAPGIGVDGEPDRPGKHTYRDLFPEQDRRREREAALPPVAPPPPLAPQAPPLPFRISGVWADETQRKFLLSHDGPEGRTAIVCRRCGGGLADGSIGPGDPLFGEYRLQSITPGRLTFMYLPLSTTQTIVIDDAMRANGK